MSAWVSVGQLPHPKIGHSSGFELLNGRKPEWIADVIRINDQVFPLARFPEYVYGAANTNPADVPGSYVLTVIFIGCSSARHELRTLRDCVIWTWRRVAAACSIRYRSARGRPDAQRRASSGPEPAIARIGVDKSTDRLRVRRFLLDIYFLLIRRPPLRSKFAPTPHGSAAASGKQIRRATMRVCQRAIQSQTRPSRAIGPAGLST